ncbi:MAG: hypothetical protein ACXVIJ_16320 [Thermoanaerobaculia bacterium]
MKQLTHRQYDALEAAIIHSRRVSVYRRGTEYLGIPQRIWQDGQREAVSILHPTTGEEITVYLDEIEHMDVLTR